MNFNFENLTVWQEAMKLVKMVYETTRRFPREERYGLSDQLRRAAASIASNIAEGKGRYHRKEFVQFLYIARGSLYETITLIKTAAAIQLLNSENQRQLLDQCSGISSKLSGLIKSMK